VQPKLCTRPAYPTLSLAPRFSAGPAKRRTGSGSYGEAGQGGGAGVDPALLADPRESCIACVESYRTRLKKPTPRG
jgi:hypothetical protein